jgi:hypothetical protein
MTADLGREQFEVVIDDDLAATFGHGLPIFVTDGGFDPGTASWRTQDAPLGQAGGTAFGRDVLDGPVWTWELTTNAQDADSALASAALLGGAWRGPVAGWTPGAMARLRYRIGDRPARFIYGRPRRWSGGADNRILTGAQPITMDFQAADALHYEDDRQEVTVTLAASNAGGFVVPFETPIVTAGSPKRASAAQVGGNANARPTIKIEGPITNPWVTAAGWKLQLRGTLVEGSSVVVETLPWARSAIRDGVASAGGMLDPRVGLERFVLPPGAHDIVFGGISNGVGQPRATVSWHDAWTTL